MRERWAWVSLTALLGVGTILACDLGDPYTIAPPSTATAGASAGGGGAAQGGAGGNQVAGSGGGGVGAMAVGGGDGGNIIGPGGAGGALPDTCVGFEPLFAVGCLGAGTGAAGGGLGSLREYSSTFDPPDPPAFLSEWGSCPDPNFSVTDSGHLRVVDCDGQVGAGKVAVVTPEGSLRGCLVNLTLTTFLGPDTRLVLFHSYDLDGTGGAPPQSNGTIQVAISGTDDDATIQVARWDSPTSPVLGTATGLSLPLRLFIAHDADGGRICAGVLTGDLHVGDSYQCIGCWNDAGDGPSEHLLSNGRVFLATSGVAEFDDLNVP